jgi:DNA-directed RNA polymerase specialized sigma24 family protein
MVDFPPTRWSLVVAACADLDDGRARNELCALYLAPIRAVVRNAARAARDAQDLTQSVFAHLLQPGVLARASPESGPFRNWLTLVIRTVLSSKRKHARALKRGGGAIMLSIDVRTTEGQPVFEPADPRMPDRCCVHRERAELHQRVMAELARHYTSRKKREQFQRLRPFIDGREAPYVTLSREFGVAAVTLRQQVFQMKRCYAALVRADFRRRGVKPADIDNEIRNLLDESS